MANRTITIMEDFMRIKDFSKKIGKEGPLLGIDYGSKKIGLGVSDVYRAMTFPVCTVNNEQLEQVIKELINIIRAKKVCGIVLGYPMCADNTEGAFCVEVKKFVELLSKEISIPIFLQDERFSSQTAHMSLRELGMNRRDREERSDQVAACHILQTVLDLLKVDGKSSD